MKRENWLFKVIMVIVITSLVITVAGCQPAEPKPSNGDTSISVPPSTSKSDPTGEPTCQWGEAQEVSTWDDGGYFLPKEWIERYTKGLLGQQRFYDFILSPSFARGITEDSRLCQTCLPIMGGGPQVSPKNGEFYIHPDDQARLDQGEQLESVRVLWFGHVPSLEKEHGQLVNANGESPQSDWIAFRFRIVNVFYGRLPRLIILPSGGLSLIKIRAAERSLFGLELP
ncbi:MAG: hypothetical protein GX939_00470 [Clostridiaceae bacterium]|jgi:hypothetical protein|nr:hypothetical protein [Clostridiaceae bacterium]